MKGSIRIFIVIASGLLFSVAVFLTDCSADKNKVADIRGEAYADPKTCVQCHKNIHDSYSLTGHFNTSAPITTNHLAADIIADSSEFILNDSLKIKVRKDEKGLYQGGLLNNREIISGRFDVAFGSGEKAQTYGYWVDNKLYELPLSYFRSIRNWAGSPGFPSHTMYYGREIVSRCFECHGTYVKREFENQTATAREVYDKKDILYGIDCQRCHGAAAKHVEFHLDNPDIKKANYITTYKSLNRQQKVDICGVCHSGNDLSTIRSTFYFQPGDTAANFYEPNFGGGIREPDLHGNQYAMLRSSKCFSGSMTMTCTTCHDSHTKETPNPVLYSSKCLDCHKEQTHNFCKMAPQLGKAITGKCIDCHMPALPSKLISFRMSGKKQTSQYLLQSHRIAIYPEQTKQILSLIKNGKTGR